MCSRIYIISSLGGGPNFSEGVNILQENKFRGVLIYQKISSGGNQFGGVHFYHDSCTRSNSEPVNNPNPTGCNVIETIGVYKFLQILGWLQLARKVALDQVAYENEARGVKSLKIQAIRRCNKSTIVDERVKNPNRTGVNACL